MLNLKYLLSLIFLLESFSGLSQEKKKFEVDSLPYPERYQKIKALYVKRIDSDVYKNSKKASWVYYDMLNLEASDSDEHSKMSSLEWSKANLYKTDFGSFEEAEREWKKLEDALFLETKENKEYWDYYLKCLVTTKFMILNSSSKRK